MRNERVVVHVLSAGGSALFVGEQALERLQIEELRGQRADVPSDAAVTLLPAQRRRERARDREPHELRSSRRIGGCTGRCKCAPDRRRQQPQRPQIDGRGPRRAELRVEVQVGARDALHRIVRAHESSVWIQPQADVRVGEVAPEAGAKGTCRPLIDRQSGLGKAPFDQRHFRRGRPREVRVESGVIREAGETRCRVIHREMCECLAEVVVQQDVIDIAGRVSRRVRHGADGQRLGARHEVRRQPAHEQDVREPGLHHQRKPRRGGYGAEASPWGPDRRHDNRDEDGHVESGLAGERYTFRGEPANHIEQQHCPGDGQPQPRRKPAAESREDRQPDRPGTDRADKKHACKRRVVQQLLHVTGDDVVKRKQDNDDRDEEPSGRIDNQLAPREGRGRDASMPAPSVVLKRHARAGSGVA